MDPLQWMGAVGMRVQTTDFNVIPEHKNTEHKWRNLIQFKFHAMGED